MPTEKRQRQRRTTRASSEKSEQGELNEKTSSSAQAASGEPTGGTSPTIREITDATTLRALAHPVRIAILEVLTLSGPLTATEVGEQISESPTTCSFHLRQLARYGFVEEAGGGKGRSRPWRLTNIGMSYGGSDDAETEIAAGAVNRIFRERALRRYLTWQETRGTYPKAWRDAATDSECIFYLTHQELVQLNQQLRDLLMPLAVERMTDPSKRPPGSVPVEMLLLGYPIQLPGEEV
jgi:DNA-binding transcriptional ArsR family regulator